MSPLDGLKRILPNKDKIYRPNSRINFLINQPASPDEQARRGGPSSPSTYRGEPTADLDEPRRVPLADQNETIKSTGSGQNYHQPSPERFSRPAMDGKKHALIKIILISFLIIIISGVMYLSEKLFGSGMGVNLNPLSGIKWLVSPADKRIDGELNDRVNILAMGVGGEGHDGPYLTDTIIVISIKPSTGEVGLLSLPRDMIVKIKNGGWPKINSVYTLGRTQDPDHAEEYVAQVIGELLDLPIHYYGIITFSGFEKFIDEIGGISVNVPRAFTDYLYPTKNYKVQTVGFKAGLQNMDGEDALIYARSRHGNNFEGSDFARSRRQQLILQAVKEKLFKFSTLLSPNKMGAIMDLLGESVETNLSIWQGLKIAQMLEKTDDDKIYRLVLDDSPDSLLEPGYAPDGAWILQPKDGNYQTLARQFKNIFNIGKIKTEGAKLEIQNGTEIEGLAYWTNAYLAKLGYTIIKYGNAPTQDYQRTVIYDLSDGQKNTTLKWLKQELNAYTTEAVETDLTKNEAPVDAANSTEAQKQPDFLIILGTDYSSTFKLPEPKPVQTTSTKPLLPGDESVDLSTSTKELTE
ncbi:MAG: LCP family protein [Candidatus Komeilibacteria bacterium]|nr:LCP family protein [Candidatus Komeilibacteria bacterium]